MGGTGVEVGGSVEVGVGESAGVTGVGESVGEAVGDEIGVSLASGVGVGEIVSSGNTRAVDFLDRSFVGVGSGDDLTASVDRSLGLDGLSCDGGPIWTGG